MSQATPIEKIFSSQANAQSSQRKEASAGTWKVLIVDDDEMVRRVSSRMLKESEILFAGSGAEACEVLEGKNAEGLDCVLLDMKMPGLSFEESFEGIRRLHPDVAVVACSGNSFDSVGGGFAEDHRTGFLGKPFTRQELKDAIGRAILNSSA
jgi:two-component system response regulator (stage 0 sporulation protein F)